MVWVGTSPEHLSELLYSTESGRHAAFASYDAMMKNWSIPYTEEWISGSFGSTHVIVSGPPDGRPVLLLPGLFADATMWYNTVGDLSKTYRVLCVDQITYGGKSQPSKRAVKTAEDYGVWFRELLMHFRYNRVAFGGLSYGSWLSLELARMFPMEVAAIIMLDPSETLMDGGTAWRGFWDFSFFPSRKTHRRFFNWLGGG